MWFSMADGGLDDPVRAEELRENVLRVTGMGACCVDGGWFSLVTRCAAPGRVNVSGAGEEDGGPVDETRFAMGRDSS